MSSTSIRKIYSFHKFGRVRGFFIRDHNFALQKDVATAIAQLACHENALPQGSPSSPVISNLIAHILDIHLLASSVGCTYSRYADDLTFLTNKKDFPVEIAQPSSTDLHVWTAGDKLSDVIQHSGFGINAKKTHMQYRASRQEVTGLVVNKRINIPSEYRHTVRAMVHSLLNTGSFTALAPVSSSGTVALNKQQGTANQLHGMLGFIDAIDLYYRNHVTGASDSDPLSSKELMYRRFLIYENFFASDRPVVLCEGETDNIYLTHAIRSLAGSYPDLAMIAPNGKINIVVRLYKYRRYSTARLLGLRGGSGCLNKFIATYKKETGKFKAAGESIRW